jgi:hypothetical protein
VATAVCTLGTVFCAQDHRAISQKPSLLAVPPSTGSGRRASRQSLVLSTSTSMTRRFPASPRTVPSGCRNTSSTSRKSSSTGELGHLGGVFNGCCSSPDARRSSVVASRCLHGAGNTRCLRNRQPACFLVHAVHFVLRASRLAACLGPHGAHCTALSQNRPCSKSPPAGRCSGPHCQFQTEARFLSSFPGNRTPLRYTRGTRAPRLSCNLAEVRSVLPQSNQAQPHACRAEPFERDCSPARTVSDMIHTCEQMLLVHAAKGKCSCSRRSIRHPFAAAVCLSAADGA